MSDDLQVGVFANFDGVTAADTTPWLNANLDDLIASIDGGRRHGGHPSGGLTVTRRRRTRRWPDSPR